MSEKTIAYLIILGPIYIIIVLMLLKLPILMRKYKLTKIAKKYNLKITSNYKLFFPDLPESDAEKEIFILEGSVNGNKIKIIDKEKHFFSSWKDKKKRGGIFKIIHDFSWIFEVYSHEISFFTEINVNENRIETTGIFYYLQTKEIDKYLQSVLENKNYIIKTNKLINFSYKLLFAILIVFLPIVFLIYFSKLLFKN
jgi:hypothetical protein